MSSNQDLEHQFIAYLEGELEPIDEEAVLHKIAADEDLRAMLRFELRLNDALPQWEHEKVVVPDGFTDRVMMQLPASETDPAASKVDGMLRSLYEWIWRQRSLVWRPIYAVMLLIVLGAGAWWLQPDEDAGFATMDNAMTVSQAERMVQPASGTASEEVMLRFVYFDEDAESIAVAGDFSDWEPIPLTQKIVNGKRVWTGMVAMSRGQHNYMFRVDGEKWVTDPMASVQREDGFGNKNAVVYL